MKKIAVIGISAKAAAPAIGKLGEEVAAIVDKWIHSKGRIRDSSDGEKIIHLGDKGDAKFVDICQRSDAGFARKIQISEPIPNAEGIFRTTLHYAVAQDCIDIVCMLDFESPRYALTPAKPIANLPAVMRDIMRASPLWCVGKMNVCADPIPYLGGEGAALAKLILDKERALPLVVVSQYRGEEVVEKLSSSLARDLAGLAIVARVDADSSWQLTQELGRDCSCYGGAIRIYWPRPAGSSEVRDPIWLKNEILTLHRNHRGGGIRERLRNLLFDISSYRPRFSPLIKIIDEASRASELKKRIEDAKSSGAEFASAFAQDFERLEEENRRLKTDLANLDAQLMAEREVNAGLLQQIKSLGDGALTAGDEKCDSLSAAVALAKKKFGDSLIFGADVSAGVRKLNPKAGPPQKVFHWLEKLAELSALKKSGALGMPMSKWLNEKNIDCSGESERVRNSRKSQQRRTWDAGGVAKAFDLHLKVNEKADPGLCVRIYIDWDDQSQKIVVGWVGQHPE